jgi:predicted nucleic acid-binding protein
MKVLVDTSVWSMVLRRGDKNNLELKNVLSKLVEEFKVFIIGPIRQELLSGIKTQPQFDHIRSSLSAFPDYLLTTLDYELAAKYFNICRSKGIQGSNVDFLICAVAFNNDFEIFTQDEDFIKYSKCLPIKLYSFKINMQGKPRKGR